MNKTELPGEKRKGHLTLLRQTRPITTREFNALDFRERLEIVRLAQGRQKYQLIIDAVDGMDLVQALPAQDLYVLIKEMGMEDVFELIAMASVEQLTTFIDLDSWDKDEIKGETALKWLALAMSSGEEAILETLQSVDFELLILIFKQFITILTGPEVLLDEDAIQERSAGDKVYQIRYSDPEIGKLIDRILDCLYRNDQGLYLLLLESIRGELSIPLQEAVFQDRKARLKDYGFPDLFEAMDIYARIDLAAFDPAAFHRAANVSLSEGPSPGFVLTLGKAKDLLSEVLKAGVSEASAWDLTFLLNKAMVADRIDIGERTQVQAELEMVYGYLNLALERLCGEDSKKAIDLFDETYLLPLFRFGFNLTLSLQQRAKALLDSTIAPYLDGPYAALITALSGKKPRYFAGLEEGGRSTETRIFSSLGEVRRSEKWLNEIDVQRRLFEDHFGFNLPVPEQLDLTGCQPEEVDQITLSDLFLTALANRLFDRPFLPLPIPVSELGYLHAMITHEGRVAEGLRRETLAWLISLEPEAEGFANFCMEILDEEFCPLDPDHLDPRYIGGFLIDLERGDKK